MNIGSTLTGSAFRWPNKECLVFEQRRWTFRALNQLANQAANAFAAHGVGKGDKVAILTWNLPEQVASFYGLLKIGAVPVPVNYRLAANEVKYIVDNCEAKILVFEESLRAQAAAVIRDPRGVEHVVYIGDRPEEDEIPFDLFIAKAADVEPRLAASNDDPAFIMYTSGTTGLPKGVVRSHRAELMGAMIQSAECNFRHDDVIIHNKPLFHIAQLQVQLLPFILYGGTGIMTRGFDVHETLSLVEKERITCLHGVPTQMVMMMQADLTRYDLSSLRMGFFGGQTLNDQTTLECMKLFPDSFQNIYGATEVLSVIGVDYRRRPDKLGSVGHPLANIGARIIKLGSADPADVVGPGENGQVIISSPTLMTEYFHMPERTAAVLREGWYFTGDAGFRDEEGFMTVLGRIDHTIKSGGENIHPSEVENVLFEHPGIADAAVVGLPSRKWGDVVAAAIIRKDPALSAETLDQYCVASPDLANFKRPRHYFFVDEIPSNPTGKVERHRLKEILIASLQGPLE
jgi:long-chain acyl-CoA synthetase